MASFAPEPQSPLIPKIWGALTALGDQDTAYRQNQHMNKVFAANPAFAQLLYGAQNDQAKLGLLQDQQRRELARQNALKQLAAQAQGLDAGELIGQVAATTGEPDALLALAKLKRQQETGFNPDLPSAVQEYQYFSKLDPAAQKEYLGVKRAQQVLDLGSRYGVLAPTGAVTPVAEKSLAPNELPETKAAQAEASAAGQERGKETGAAQATLASMQANMPNLEKVVMDLSALGKTATYTQAGQLADATKRQLGLPVGEGATARTEYIAKVDNEVLPLLRQTFGAAFTQKEGESLKATLGDPNKSPEEKDAVLKAFIESKKAQVESLQRQTGQLSSSPLRFTVTKTINGVTYGKDKNGKWYKQ